MAAPQMSFADFLLQSKGLAPIFKPPQMPGTLNLSPQAPPVVPPQIGPQAPQAAPQGLMENLRRDPSLSLALMQAGLSMMQPHSKQQTHVGHIAQSALGGINTYIGDKERKADRALKDTHSRIQQNADARQGEQAAREAETYQYNMGRRPKVEKMEDLQLRNATTEAGYNEEKARLYQIFGEKEANARLAQIGASTNASNARAKAYADGTAGAGGSMTGLLQIVNMRAANLRQLNPEMSEQQAWDTAYGEQKGSKENILGAISQARAARASIISNTIGGKMSPAQQQEYDALGDWITELQGNRNTARGQTGTEGTIDRTGGTAPPPAATPTFEQIREQIRADAAARYLRRELPAMPDDGTLDQQAIQYLNTHYPGWAATSK